VPDVGRPGPGEVRVDVAATAVNRADLMQRQGHYPPPPGASEIIGLECSGTIAELGAGVPGWSVGDQVCCLLAGGGYAEQVLVPAGQLLPIPAGLSLVEAAALPEVACTVWSNVFDIAALQDGEAFLVHGGAGGIGTMAIQAVRALRPASRVLCTAGSQAKLDRCRELGAHVAISYKDDDFVARSKAETGSRGVDVLLDNMGAKYLTRNLDALALDGRLVIIGLQGGSKAEINLGAMLPRRLSLHATTLRGRPADQKARVVAGTRSEVWPAIADGRIRPVIDRVLPVDEVVAAHRSLEESSHVGKVVLTLR
jgi:NADPH2:quinone reductase